MRTRSNAAGFTLVEGMIASAIMGGVLLGAYGLLARDRQLTGSTLSIGTAEQKAQAMLRALESELVDARGAIPRTQTITSLGSSDTSAIRVVSTAGFPDQGWLIVDRGNASVERVRYGELASDGSEFQDLQRAEQCTEATTHGDGADVLWAGCAYACPVQPSPEALRDGRALVGGRTVDFLGDGTGFSFRVPTDPAGGTDYFENGEIRWGSTVDGTPLESGWSALWFQPAWVLAESVSGTDLNGDGDTLDLFDVGQIKRRAWDTSDPDRPVREVALGPTIVMQERCNWGGDLDADGFDDPLFLWDEANRRLHVRVFVLGLSSGNSPLVRRVETSVFLRNDAEG